MPLEHISKEKAEKITGIKLDGRKKYFIWYGEVCTNEKYLSHCTGCVDLGEYGTLHGAIYDEKRKMMRGGGCQECGHTGVRWNHFPAPVIIPNQRAVKNAP